MATGTRSTVEMAKLKVQLSAICFMFVVVGLVSGQVLTPPYFNLAAGRPIEATATCGVGVTEPELFCKLTGANPEKEDGSGDFEVIEGQQCDKCDLSDPTKVHSPEFAVDGTERWWQSPPLSRGLQYNEVNLTIHLEQEFHVAYVYITMGNSPRPGVFALERSKDHGKTWKPWQFFADTPSDCNVFFGNDGYSDRIDNDDAVICATEYSKVLPLEGGEIFVSLVNNRPSSRNFSYSRSLQEWTKATDIRLRLMRAKTLLGHLMAVARQDRTVTRRYYYSIKGISIGGQCVCNGHAKDCDRPDVVDTTKLVCRCQHNTCGQQCETCCPGFVQKPWRPATPDAINACEPCQCHGHSKECRYDPEVDRDRSSIDIHGRYEGGGVCINCLHNTMGINCEQCRAGYFRPTNTPISSTSACRRCRCDLAHSTGNCLEGTGQCLCEPEYTGDNCDRCRDGYYSYPRCFECQCHVNGSQNRLCEVGGGRCSCKPNFNGTKCDQCAFDYYNFPECRSCDCDIIGSLARGCDVESGQCHCGSSYGGHSCDSCALGYYNYPACDSCNCEKTGITEEVCDKDFGHCLCKKFVSGPRCDRCDPGYFKWPKCTACGCNEIGMLSNTCDAHGQCKCKRHFHGKKCDRCAPAFYKYPDCLDCNCDMYGSHGISCNLQTGQCDCAPTFEGLTCNRCKTNYYNYPTCEECTCNQAGAKKVPGYPPGGCGAHSGSKMCECKNRVEGFICDTCKPGFWNLNINNPKGCKDCGCDTRGTNGGSRFCNVQTGQCFCKPFVNSLRCNECADGTYNLLGSNVFGCQYCRCDVGGSIDQNCNKRIGQCNCRARITGTRCKQPAATHYYPTLHHMLYELEDGHTPSGNAVTKGFDSQTFPDYSWRGYAILSTIQDEVLVDVDIRKPSLYRIIYRFVNPSDRSVTAEVTAIPESSSETQQSKPVTFPPSREPQFVTVSDGGITLAFLLNPGRWSISLKVPETIFVDYLVLLPQAYYEAAILKEKVNVPCTVPSAEGLCKHFVHVDVSVYPSVRGETGLTRVGGTGRGRTQLFPDRSIANKFGVTDLAYLNLHQTSLTLNLPIRMPEKYIFIIQYYSQATGRLQELDVDVVTSGGSDHGFLKLPGCPYSSLCRQAVTDLHRDPKEFIIEGLYATFILRGRPDVDLAVDSVIAIPVGEWKVDLISPQLKCVRKDEQCISGTYITPAGTVRVDFESGNEHRIATDAPPYIVDTTVKVIKLDGSATTVDMWAFVTGLEEYVIIGHYYQPYIVGFDVDVHVQSGGQTYTGTLEANYCPSVSGCRSIIQFKNVDDMKTIDLKDVDIRLTFNSSRPVWLDYVMVIPSVQFDPETILNIQDVDRSSEFITKCGGHDFAITAADSQFCRDSVYSLTTDYNNGALQCQCNPDGSFNSTCSEFGGQCPCKPNIIGRTCSICRTDYYGFPNCRTCNCNAIGSELCDHQSVSCLCKPNVIGATCDRCRSGAFGFESGRGCELCNCGSASVTPDCDVYSGQCQCRPGVIGHKCDQCEQGYWNYGPRGCQRCTCSSHGAVTCDPRTGLCQCLRGVTGQNCDQCLPPWVMIQGIGCNECDSCVHLLLDDIEITEHNITSMRRELESVSVGIRAFQRLEKINQTVAELRPLVDNLISRPTQVNAIKRELYQVQTLAREVNTKSGRTLGKSKSVELVAADVKFRAENLYPDLVQMAIKEANEAVEFVKDILENIKGGTGGNKIEELLRQAEMMLQEIKSRDFSFSESAVKEELGKARDTLKQAKKLMNRVTAQFNRTIDMSIIVDDILNKLQDLQNSSRHSLNHSQAAIEINNRTRQIRKLVTDTNNKIRQSETDIRSCIVRAWKLLNVTEKFLTRAREAYTVLDREGSRLDAAKRDLQQSVVGLSRENTILRPLVYKASQHALQLRADAKLLESMILDTRGIAEAALNASRAYRTITDSINGALNASIEALGVAEETSAMYSGLAENATKLHRRSENLKEQADNITAAAFDLKMRLVNVQKTIEEVKKINIQIKDEYVAIISGLDGLPAGGYEKRAKEAATKAINAKKTAENAKEKIKAIVNRLPEDQRKLTEIEKNIDIANRYTRTAENDVQKVLRLVPNVTDILSRLSSHAIRIRQLGLDLKTNITLLRDRVSVARDQANLIRVGVTFSENSSLQVRSPRNLMAAGFYSRVSLYFKTSANDGLIFYAGPIQSPETWNYMALQLTGGKAVFKFDLGSGAANIMNDKFVSDGVWHEAIMERHGRNGTLTIRTPKGENFTAEGRSDAESLVLNFDDTTRVFIGGITQTEKNDLKDILPFTNFTGCIQDVSFDGSAVGLWNFVSAENVDGCYLRDVSEEPPINGYMFGGNGYVILERKRFNPARNTIVKFIFRTFAGEGLLFLTGIPGKDFLSLELKDGKVIYKYDLGSGRATIASTQSYNDGKWHAVLARREQERGILTIDSNTGSARSPGTLKDLNVDNNTYFGGFKGTHTYSNASVTQKGFEGCIKDIELGTTRRDINEHIEAKDILPGCPESMQKIVRVISFTPDVNNSYISVHPVNIDEPFEMSMKFITVENDGLLSYVTDDINLQSSAFSLSLSDGKVVVKNIVEGRVTALQSRNAAYNDGRWHYLTVRKDGENMSLCIDDSDHVTTKVVGKRITITNSTLFSGGFPSTHTIIPENVASSTPFVGSMGDVTIGHEFINFADVPPGNMIGVILGCCHIPETTANITPFTIVIHTLPTRAPVAQAGLPSDKCFLPVEPLEADDHEIETGYRFGSRPDSRQEYDKFQNSSVDRANYSVQFQTTSSNGVLFHVANKRHVAFVGIYVNKGLVSAAFNCGGGVARATSTNAYNDGQWHNLVFERNLKEGKLTIDEGAETVSVTASGTSTSIKVVAPYYVGGLPSNFSSKGASNLENVSSGFVGCLKNFLQDGKEIGEPVRVVAVDKCSSSGEVGTFFYSDAGHLVLSDNFTVGLDLEIKLEIKPRTLSGVLLSVHNQGRGPPGGDYLVLQMVNGEVIFSMDNGKGDVSTKYVPPAKNQLCDGKWHTIRAQKAKNVVILEVDQVRTSPGVGEPGVSHTNTEDPLNVGGVPERHRGIRVIDQFVGCMRRLELNKVVQDFTKAKSVGRIKLDSCPTT